MNIREIERKFRVKSYRDACANLIDYFTHQKLSPESILTADTIDDYWQVPGKADFVRVRSSWGQSANGTSRKLKEITVKQKDKGTNLDRLELNLHIEEVQLARSVLRLICGKRKARIEKREMVFFLPDATVVSVSRIGKDAFYEVEAKSERILDRWVSELRPVVGDAEPEPKSLFEIYIQEPTNEK